jgi:methanogenic corrinoid protein MtbC1
VPATTLRAWERRYQVVQPDRSGGAQRLYSNDDVERIRLIARLAALGYPLGELARSSTAALEQLRADGGVRRVDDPAVAVMTSATGGSQAESIVATMMKATHALDAAALRAALEQATKRFQTEDALDLVISPFLHEVGSAWACAALTVGHEHFASNIVRDVLGVMLQRASVGVPRTRRGSARTKSSAAPTLIATTIGGEHHEFGTLMAAIVAARAGWRVLYLGSNLPAENIVRVATETNARVIVLGIVYGQVTRLLRNELTVLRNELAPDVRLVSGGASTGEHQLTLRRARVERVASRAEFRAVLDSAWKKPA